MTFNATFTARNGVKNLCHSVSDAIGIKIQGPYKLLDATETVTENGETAKVWTFATVGTHDSDTLPYMNFSYTVYENGKETIVWRNEVLGISIAGKYTP